MVTVVVVDDVDELEDVVTLVKLVVVDDVDEVEDVVALVELIAVDVVVDVHVPLFAIHRKKEQS